MRDRRSIGCLIALLVWPSVMTLPVVAATRLESKIIDHCASTDLWRVERGKLVLDEETFGPEKASLQIVASGVYERVAPVDNCRGLSYLVFPNAKRPIKLVGHLRDRNRAHYILETRYVEPRKERIPVEFTLDSATLAPWSIDLNHHLDFPLYSIGLMVTAASGETINLDRITLSRAIGPTDEELVIRERTRSWSRKLRGQPLAGFRQAMPVPEPVTFDQREDTWLVKGPYYQANIDPQSGSLTQLEFGPRGEPPVPLEISRPWVAVSWKGQELLPGPVSSAEWKPKLKSLSVHYASGDGLSGEVRYLFRGRTIEVQLRLDNHTDHVIRWVRFPGEIAIPSEMVQSAIWPRLGGVQLLPTFFEQGRFSRAAYPADGFSDFVAFRMNQRTLAVGTVQSRPFFQSAEPVIRGKPETARVCYLHDMAAFIPPNCSWTFSPLLFWLAQKPKEALDQYRQANGWDRTPDLRSKLGGDLFEQMSRTALLKWDFDLLGGHFRSGENTFSDAANWVQALPGKFLLHPVSYWNPPGRGPQPYKIFDKNHPNFLPAADRLGGDARFSEFIKQTRSTGNLVAPYVNPTAWGRYAQGFEDYGEEIAILSEKGNPHWGWNMYSADPYHPVVQQKTDELVDAFAGSHRVDLLFEDQVGARPNYLNLREQTPHPLAYTEGWIRHARDASQKLPLMTERGFDALIPYEAAFCGVELGLACTRYMKGWEWDGAYGQGNWRVFPLEAYLCHDKCALYHHDLGQFVLSDYDLAWCLVRGYNLQMHYPGDEKWINICQAFQEAIGPYVFGEPLQSFQYLGDYLVESRFPRVTVVANFHPDSDWYLEGNHSIPPNGVLAVVDGGRLRAGLVKHFHGLLLGDRRYVIEFHYGNLLVFRDVVPTGETYRLLRHLEWPEGHQVRGVAVTRRGSFPLEVREMGRRFEFTYPASLDGEPVLRAEFRAEPRQWQF